jgi:NNP family nitrate/nitrite transporter-like MFS transporter
VPGARSWGAHLALGTCAFFICFTAWGLVSGFAPQFRGLYQLSATETALLVAVPVLLGALARLPMGIAADRLGARGVFSALMILVAIPVYLVPYAGAFPSLLVLAFLLGLAGSSFSVGVNYVSGWAAAGRQGTALGIYGLGTMGQSAAVMLGPIIGAHVGRQWVFRGTALLLAVSGVAFALLGRNAPARGKPPSLGAALGLLRHEPRAWALAAFYFLTFGGFVAFSIYLPVLLRDLFGLAIADAGMRAAGFVVVATLCRPLGGALADRIGGARVLAGVFLGVVPFTLLLLWTSMVPFTVGALGCAIMLGLGNGAVFKLVPEYFPASTGTVTGLVGAMGGLGGFFPPLLLGALRDHLGVLWPGFLLLAAVALALSLVNARVFLRPQRARESLAPAIELRTMQKVRAGSWATAVAGLLVAVIVIGSRNLHNFDAALVIYTFALIFGVWGATYHYWVWLQKPPTRRFWERGWQLLRREPVLPLLGRALSVAVTHVFAQTFILRRSRSRWLAHQLLFWGCLLAVAITFPLVFGWVHFRTAPQDPQRYVTYLFGFPVGAFALHTPIAWLVFHGLDVAAFLVIGGVALSLARRLRERSALALQAFDRDFLPLVLLMAVSVTGLGLTVSASWLGGGSYQFLAILHAVTVVAVLLYLPFGKFFHIIQRPAQIGVKLYQAAGAHDEGAVCPRCRQRFASRMQIDDLKDVLVELGFEYGMPGPAQHWQSLCPPCKRRGVAAAQLRLKGTSP